MKRIILTSLILTLGVTVFNACRKKVYQNINRSSIEEMTYVIDPCPLSDISEWSYYDFGQALCGYLSGQGTIGAIDTRLNCTATAGTSCSPVTSPNIYILTYSTDIFNGSNALNDGVITVAEQQALITQIINTCNSHKNSNYGSNYSIYNYDIWFDYPLCGGCPDEILIFVKYKASKLCRS